MKARRVVVMVKAIKTATIAATSAVVTMEEVESVE
jgi:hypothetical protein